MNQFLWKSALFFFVIGLILYNFAPDTYNDAKSSFSQKTGVEEATVDKVFSNSTTYIKDKAKSAAE